METLFISDLHLSEERPDLLAQFLAFVEGPARDAAALYILGDLFEYWAGDDDGDAPLPRQVAQALAAAQGRGLAIHFMAGNRDFLIGPDYARQAGMTLLPDPSVVELDGQRLLLLHGDSLCTDDVAYQTYRTQVRNPAYQAQFLAQPLAARRAFIEQIRQKSEAAKRDKAEEIMDVNAGAVADVLRQHDFPILIHGHTHRPAHHRLDVDGRTCERWVLSDWRDSAPYLAWTGTGLEYRELR
ncbi:MAG: UDP-2,3-diacylglucosamine diphosphatase [Zoogloeaceae bacterium]|nr:UDP-2,3-diacylglucosamine diphosphatase [Zoogloeaceae bacterium]